MADNIITLRSGFILFGTYLKHGSHFVPFENAKVIRGINPIINRNRTYLVYSVHTGKYTIENKEYSEELNAYDTYCMLYKHGLINSDGLARGGDNILIGV